MKNNRKTTPSAEKKSENLSAGKKSSSLKNFLKSRKAKRGSVAVLLTVLFIAAVVILNIVVNILTEKFPALSVDMTKGDVFELQEDSIEYVKNLDKNVTITVLMSENDFESSGDYYVQANQLLSGLENYSSKITVKYVDLSSNPTFITPYSNIDWTSNHLILVESGDDYRALDASDLFDYNQEYLYYYGSYVIEGQHVEQAVITAILNTTTEEKVTVTVLSGQGEEDSSPFVTLLENNAFEVEEVSLLTGAISDESQFLIIFDPAEDIDDDAFTTISDWLYNNGSYGHTLVYLPTDQADISKFKNLNALLEEWGVAVDYGYIFETNPSYMTNSGDPYLISIFDYASDDYTDGLKNTSIPVVLFYTMPVEILDDTMAEPLLVSSEDAVFLPKDAGEDWDYQEQEKGVMNGAVIATQGNDDASSHVLVIGSYDAWSNSALNASAFNNGSYFVNLFNKIAARDEIGITIEGKSLESTELGVTSTATLNILSVIIRFIIPAAVLIVGLIVWIKRRNK